MKMYSCTMHPVVKSDKPGKCLKCGMDVMEKNKPHNKYLASSTSEKK